MQGRQIRRRLQGEPPAVDPGAFGFGPGSFDLVLRQTSQARGVVDHQTVGVGGVEHVLFEARGEVCQFFLHGLEAFLGGGREFSAAESEVTQFVADDALLRRVEACEFGRCGQLLVTAVERFVLRHLGVELGELGQERVVHFAQFGRVLHGVEMRHLAPGAGELFACVFQRLHEVVPGGGRARAGHLRHHGTVLGQQDLDGGGDVGYGEFSKARQAAKIQQRVIHGYRLQ